MRPSRKKKQIRVALIVDTVLVNGKPADCDTVQQHDGNFRSAIYSNDPTFEPTFKEHDGSSEGLSYAVF